MTFHSPALLSRLVSRVAARCGIALAGLALAGAAAAADAYPTKPVSLLVPYPAGGLSDVIARIVNVPLASRLGQPVLVENLGGAGGAIAAQKVLDAAADGQWVYQGSPNEIILAPLANKAVKFKSEDFRMVQFIADFPIAIFARKGLAANTADEFVALARKAAREGKPLTYASVGTGSFYHLLGEDLAKKINAPLLHVPYKGAADVVKDLIGEQVDIFISPYGKPHINMAESGRMKFIAALSPKRQPALPNVPSVDEGVALKGYHHTIWTAYFVKKSTPEPIVQTLHKALTDTLRDPKVQAGLQAQSADVPKPLSLADASKAYADGTARFRAIAKSINLQAQ